MCDLKYLLLASALVAAASAFTRTLELNAILNKTICAVEVVFDENPDRIPQRIKMMKCAEKTGQWCDANNIPHRQCCHHTNHHAMECVELTDQVLVFDKKQDRMVRIDVSVGCTCLIGRATEAPSVPGPPT